MGEGLLVAGARPATTRSVTRGTRRFLRASGFAVLAELPLPDGGRADLVALSSDGVIRIIEVKSSNADFRADAKWMRYRLHCDQFYFAIPADMPAENLPQDAGLIVADAHGAMMLREAPPHKLAPAGRRSMLIRFAKQAAERLHGALHPDEFMAQA
jgi:hypothetical protein